MYKARTDCSNLSPLFWSGGLDHRKDAGPDRLGQLGPGGHDGDQVGVSYYAITGSATGSARETRRVILGRSVRDPLSE
jgi:hypothetical protein